MSYPFSIFVFILICKRLSLPLYLQIYSINIRRMGFINCKSICGIKICSYILTIIIRYKIKKRYLIYKMNIEKNNITHISKKHKIWQQRGIWELTGNTESDQRIASCTVTFIRLLWYCYELFFVCTSSGGRDHVQHGPPRLSATGQGAPGEHLWRADDVQPSSGGDPATLWQRGRPGLRTRAERASLLWRGTCTASVCLCVDAYVCVCVFTFLLPLWDLRTTTFFVGTSSVQGVQSPVLIG